ncbi:MAG TPA: YifB family Mg chelatase-like AAA ATPase [Gammaproteobacteria bacterium]|nr:YifB family Mg chelatase-like AAA ATPase [Gammaproteobacteria bacterium]
MPLARLLSRGQRGLKAYEVIVEVHLSGGLPGFAITGLPAAAVRESRDRVRAALQTCGYPVPSKRVTVHLAPADIPKEGGRFDLPIALGVAKAEHGFSWAAERVELIGELALNGDLRSVTGALPAVLAAHEAGRAMILPRGNRHEAALVEGAEVFVADTLGDVIAHLDGRSALERVATQAPKAPLPDRLDLADVRGQQMPKRALAVAAAGGHNLIMIGPPGSGKSMLAERLRGLLPPLEHKDMLCVASIASVAGDTEALANGMSGGLRAPFRSPHHTTSAMALVGGGSRPRPGEISLAHRGVLFLDELPEFSRTALEALREPLEAGVARISRVHEQITFPAEFQLVAAMNPCPCGHLGDGTDRCNCSPERVERYRSRISGPLLDRFDLHVEVPRVPFAEIGEASPASETPALAEHIAEVRARQIRRRGRLNARVPDALLREVVVLDREARGLLNRAAERWQLSMRAYARVLKVALTIAELEGCERVGAAHVGEALQLRRLDRPR